MYLHRARIDNIRSLKSFDLAFAPGECPGWHVLVGDNGSGKSTIVRAIAVALAGPSEAAALRQNWADWLRNGEKQGAIRLDLDHRSQVDKVTGRGRALTKFMVPVGLHFVRTEPRGPRRAALEEIRYDQVDPERYIWGTGAGWFCASYGPFRRFTGGSKDYEKLFYSNPRLAPHLSAFGEDVALTECLVWLRDLHVKQLERRTERGLLDDVKAFINEGGLLPHNTVLDNVTSDAVVFRDGNGCEVDVDQLSDGYRAILSLTFELIRQLVRTYGGDKVFRHIRRGQMKIDLPGVVLVDEIDAHLHPTWQRRVGQWFVKYFPKLQFIVTTHSPLVCQAAEFGTVWRLPTPGSDEVVRRVKGTELQRLVFGNVLEAFDTEVFGQDVTRSASSQQKLQRLAELNVKALRTKLNAKERRELEQLRATLPTAIDAGLGDIGTSS